MNFFQRTPFAILGAIGLLGVLHNFLEWHSAIKAALNFWREFSVASVEGFLGWLANLVGNGFYQGAEEYYVMSVILLATLVENTAAQFKLLKEHGEDKGQTFTYFNAMFMNLRIAAAWPILMPAYLWGAAKSGYYIAGAVFWETIVYALVIIATNYALIYSAG